MKKNNQNNQSGSVLIALMIFVVLSVTIVSAAVLLVIDSTVVSTNQQVGTLALSIAESGVENAILRLLRNPSYTGEVLPVSSGSATLSVTGINPLVVRSVGRVDGFERTIEATLTRNNGVLTVDAWQEVE
ncbi:MAG: hypothetical protein COU66_04005 [Candidatus Pacebacteria bacterium CG10_big_fil_rev_8_21_14_0_10_44_11]|nr:MAG: hypothetical protein COU66_04005 [Candidatus Pacebacteria bacterium CG10_big_fil_rev_8_21_14_0_10_44_11]